MAEARHPVPGGRRASRARRASAGFTLIEVLVALVVLSTGIILILRAFETSLVALAESRDAAWGHLLAREILAETRLACRAGAPVARVERGRASSGPVNDFQWERYAEPVQDLSRIRANGATNTLLRVEVSTWRAGASRRYSITTYLARFE